MAHFGALSGKNEISYFYISFNLSFIGSYIASIRMMSSSQMGMHTMTSFKFFSKGLTSYLLSNFMVLIIALNIFIDKKIGEQWFESIGIIHFNLLFYVVAPVAAYFGGVFCNIVFTIIAAKDE
ncbi:MAG: hypothetical protein IPQ18_14475 [Saprospiraceae bacterium]|nr:hypothetical protein [Saprospiraceae bacterium]